ncbi:hypothetical protein BHE74_00052017 [Ensete ventricosum]|nr:hypothetical protein BHE74_00052017 [Ensete ventricosum]
MPNLLLMSFCTPVFVGQCEPLPEMVKGVMLRARMLCRPPMTSLRCGFVGVVATEGKDQWKVQWLRKTVV